MRPYIEDNIRDTYILKRTLITSVMKLDMRKNI